MLQEKSSYVEQHHLYNAAGSWRSWHERAFGTHGKMVENLAELHRPTLAVTDMGAGKLSYYLNRLSKVVQRGGTYTAVEIDSHFINEAVSSISKTQDRSLVRG